MSISVDVLKDYVRLEELSVRIRRGERVSIEDGIESLDYNFTLRKAREAYCKSKKAESIFRRLMLWFSNVFSKMKVSKKQKNQPMNSCRGWGPGIHHPFIMYYEKTCPMCELIKKLKKLEEEGKELEKKGNELQINLKKSVENLEQKIMDKE